MESELILLNEMKRRLNEEWEYPKELIFTEAHINKSQVADIVVLRNNDTKDLKNPYIIVEVKKEYSKKGIIQLMSFMSSSGADYGIFYSGKDIVFLNKRDNDFEEIVRLPKYGEKLRDLEKQVKKNQLKPGFNFNTRLNEIYDYLYTNEGLKRDKLSNELIKLILMKIVDEKSQGFNTKFWISEKEYTSLIKNKESKKFMDRIQELWIETKHLYPDIFEGQTEISLQPLSIAEIVRRLQEISFINTKEDIKNAIFQTLISDKTIRRKGEIFTPQSVIELAITTLNPNYKDYIIDPTCGSGKFLIDVMEYIKSKKDLNDLELSDLGNYILGIDINSDLVKMTKTNMILFGNNHPHVFYGNSLLPLENLSNNAQNAELLKNTALPSSFDVIFSNPPKTSDTKLIDIEKFDLAYKWKFDDQCNRWIQTENLSNRQRLDVLFIERCWQLLKPNGRMGIIIPDGILVSPVYGYVRQWIIDNTRILASISLPQTTFMPETGTKLSLLLLQKIDSNELYKINEKGYSIFMAEIEKIGHDGHRNTIYKRDKSGNILKDTEGNSIIDSDIPEIIKCFNEYKKSYNLDF